MATFKERLQALREKLSSKKEKEHKNEPLWRYKAKQARERAAKQKAANYNPEAERIPKEDLRETVAKKESSGSGLAGKVIKAGIITGLGLAGGTYLLQRAGVIKSKRRGRLTKAEKQQGYSTRRGVREPSILVRTRKARRAAVQRMQTDTLAYQNVKQDNTPTPKGVTAPQEQPIGMDAMLPMEALRNQRDVFLEEPERFKTHRSYGNFDFIGKSSKKGATMYQYDLEAMFR